jgi:hypothetical protein
VRRSLLVALWTAVIACGTDEPRLGVPCSLTAPCDPGAVCDMTADGGPICIAADGDIDGDGIPNDKDFCNHQPGGELDEDRDGIGDDCDRCPIAPPRAQPDTDNDEVDAPCDPEPSVDGNVILLFDGFGKGLDPRWEPTTASAWQVRGGELIVTLDTIGTQEYLKTNVVGKNSIAIETSYRVDRIEGSHPRHLVGIYAEDPRPAGAAKMQCYVTRADQTQAELVVVETNMGAMNQPATGAFESANLYRAGGQVVGTMAGCSVLSNGNPLGTVQSRITSDQLSSIALTAQATTVRYQYILVVGR